MIEVLNDEEIQARVAEYWELYRDLWNEGIIDESDYESGFDYWALEAQLQHDLKAFVGWGEETCYIHRDVYRLAEFGPRKDCAKCCQSLKQLEEKEDSMPKIIIENVRGQWIVDKATTSAFQEEGTGYGDGALIEMEITNPKGLCCHPDNPIVCPHQEI